MQTVLLSNIIEKSVQIRRGHAAVTRSDFARCHWVNRPGKTQRSNESEPEELPQLATFQRYFYVLFWKHASDVVKSGDIFSAGYRYVL